MKNEARDRHILSLRGKEGVLHLNLGLIDLVNKFMVTGEGWEGGIDWEFGIGNDFVNYSK